MVAVCSQVPTTGWKLIPLVTVIVVVHGNNAGGVGSSEVPLRVLTARSGTLGVRKVVASKAPTV